MSYTIDKAIYYFSKNANYEFSFDPSQALSGTINYSFEMNDLKDELQQSSDGIIKITSGEDLFGEDVARTERTNYHRLKDALKQDIKQKILNGDPEHKIILFVNKDGSYYSAYCFVHGKGFVQNLNNKQTRFGKNYFFILDRETGPFAGSDPNIIKNLTSKAIQKIFGTDPAQSDAAGEAVQKSGLVFIGLVKKAVNVGKALFVPGDRMILPLYDEDGSPISDNKSGLTWKFKQCIINFFGGNPDLERKRKRNYPLDTNAPGYNSWKSKHTSENYIIGNAENIYDYRTKTIVKQFKDEINKYNQERGATDAVFIKVAKDGDPFVYEGFLSTPACTWRTSTTSVKKIIEFNKFVRSTPEYQSMLSEKDKLDSATVDDAFNRIEKNLKKYTLDYNNGSTPKSVFIDLINGEIKYIQQYRFSDNEKPFLNAALRFLNAIKTKVNSNLQESKKVKTEHVNKIYKDYSFIEYKNKKLHSILMESLKKDIKEDK